MTANRPEGHVPVAPAWSIARLPEETAFSTVFVRGASRGAIVDELCEELAGGDDAPAHFERARVLNGGDETTALLGYWTDSEAQRRWRRRAQALARPGVLLETAIIPGERCETIYSSAETTPGVRMMHPVEITDVHEYWGASRDRIAASAWSDLAAEPGTPLPGNLCLLRGGQVWEDCGDAEREMFFADVELALNAAIDFLATEPASGCLSCRMMRDQSIDGEDLDSSSFLAWFRDFGSLEEWTSRHPTHLAVFGAYVTMLTRLDFESRLRLWHEVTVVPAGGVHLAGTDPSPLLAPS